MERERDQQQLMLPLSDASDEENKLAMVATTTTPLSASSGPGRKPRGRPPGSKNRPKPPVIITRESESAMHPVILEIAAGCDVLDAVSAFSRRKRLGVSILNGTGAVANLSLRHLPASGSHVATTITFAGRFDILSIGGTYLPPAEGAAAAAVKVPATVTVAGGQGQVIGGQVAGGLTAAGAVVVVAATFGNADMYRLPHREEEEEELKAEDVGAHNVGPADMTLWGSRSPRAPPPHLRQPAPPHY